MNDNKKPTATFESVVEEMKTLKGAADRVEGFRIASSVIDDWKQVVGLVEAGQEEKAISAAKRPIEALRAVLSAFIRNSVFPKKVPEGQKPPVPHFVDHINRRAEDNLDGNYDEDIIAELRKKFGELEMAVRGETNGSFELRVSAYEAMKAALVDADMRQKLLDQKRRDGNWNIQKKARKKVDGDDANVAAQESAVARRQKMLAERQKRADEARSIF